MYCLTSVAFSITEINIIVLSVCGLQVERRSESHTLPTGLNKIALKCLYRQTLWYLESNKHLREVLYCGMDYRQYLQSGWGVRSAAEIHSKLEM